MTGIEIDTLTSEGVKTKTGRDGVDDDVDEISLDLRIVIVNRTVMTVPSGHVGVSEFPFSFSFCASSGIRVTVTYVDGSVS